jgi:protein O-mannosyl-transferase
MKARCPLKGHLMTRTSTTGTVLLAVLLAAATIVVYLPVTTHDFVHYDDDTYVFENPAVQQGITGKSLAWAFTTNHASNWHPLTWISHMLDCMVFNLKPAGHHLTNLLLHTANALLLFLLLLKMTGKQWQSLFVATLFALHPLHVESVAWTSERKDVLSTFFWMLTLLTYAGYAKRPGISRYLLVLLVFALGLLAKQMLVTLPFVLLLLDVWPLRRFQQLRSYTTLRLLYEKLPLLALSTLMSVAILLIQQQGLAVKPLPIAVRIANALSAYMQYIVKMFWPTDLTVLYLQTENAAAGNTVYLACAAVALISISILAMLRMKKYGWLFTGWFWYLGTLVPVAGFVQIGYHTHADRYTYIPLIGLFIIIAWGAPALLSGWRFKTKTLALLAGFVLALLIAVTGMQLKHWRNSQTLFEHALAVQPDNYVIHNNLGSFFNKKGEKEKAYIHILKAVQLNPNYTKARYNLGSMLASSGRLDEARACFRTVLQIDPNNIKAHTKLGRIALMQGNPDEAIGHLQQALRADPDYGEARYYMRKAMAAQPTTLQ